MESTELINQYRIFIERDYLTKVESNIKKDRRYINIDFNDIAKFNPELAEELLNIPDDSLKAIEIALETIESDYKGVIPRVYNLPESSRIGIGEVRKEHFDKFWQFEGTVIKLGDEMAAADIVTFECGSCGNILKVIQIDEECLKSPTRCGCGRKGKFKEISKTWKNVRHIVVEEYITDYTTKKARPTTMKVILEHDLTEESIIKKLQPGKHVRLTGIVQSKQINKSIFFNFRILCNHIIVEDVSLFNLKVPQSYIKKFKELKDDPNLITDLSESIFYRIEGQETIKEILTVSRARGIKTFRSNRQLDMRDTINPLLIGDMGGGKSDLARMAIEVDIINMVVSGRGVSGCGLTSTTSHDKELGCWVVEPGAVVRCNKGSILIDEIDKIDDKDTSALNEAMTKLSFMTAKANQQVTLQADTNIIACCNPEGRKFDRMIDRYMQITLKPDFLDRFDIWVAVEKITERKQQDKVIGKIIDRFGEDISKLQGKYDSQFIQYYYAWIIQNFKPKISDEVSEYATEEISKLMNKTGNVEGGQDISYRLVGNIIRFAIARDKLLQRNEVTKESIDKSIEYQKYGFKSLDMLTETGEISIEKIQHEEPVQIKRKKYEMIDIIKDMYEELEPSEKARGVLIEDLIKRWEREGNDSKTGEEIIEKLRMKGDIFFPKADSVRPI